MAECRIEYVFRPDDIGLQNPLGTVLHPDGAEMDDGARAGDKAVNLGSIGEIRRSDFFAGKRRREFPDIGTAQTSRPPRKMRTKPATQFPSGTGEKDRSWLTHGRPFPTLAFAARRNRPAVA